MNIKNINCIVVNDDISQLLTLSGLLKKLDINASTFTNVEEALEKMKTTGPPDLIITDLYMPGIDGWRFCRLLRSPEYKSFNSVPILVVSATYAGEEVSSITADLGANDFLPAPVNGQEFLSTVQSLLDHKQPMNHLRVLIVEDDKNLSKMMDNSFTKHGYRAEIVNERRQAEILFSGAKYDVAILDYHLPDGMGDSLLKKFKEQNHDCVCVMITSDPDPELALSWMKTGAAAYLRKPFDPEYLIEQCTRTRRERSLLRVEHLLEERTRELQKSEERYRQVNDSIQDIIYATDNKGKIIFISGAVEKHFNVSSEAFIDKSMPEVMDILKINSDVTTPIIKKFNKAIDNKQNIINYEFPIRKNEKLHYFECIENIQYDNDKNYNGRSGVLRDITERKWNEIELQKLSTAIKQSPSSFILTDTDGNIEYVNPKCTKVTGYTSEELIGKNTNILNSGEQQEKVYKELWETITTGKVWHGEFHNKTKNNDLFWETATIAPIFDKEGKITNYLKVSEDTTKYKNAEKEKEKLKNQLQQSQKMESVGRLAGGIAHDFNNTLAVIIGYSDMILTKLKNDDPYYEFLSEIKKAGIHSAELTKQLLAFARKQPIAPEVLDLNETIENMLNMLKRLIGEDIRLQFKPSEDLWKTRMDPNQVGQILTNLCVNARDAIDGTGIITIKTSNINATEEYCHSHAGFTPGEYILLSFSDDGCGMDKKTMDYAFEPFFTTKKIGEGTGLGLATIYGIIKQNNGYITLHSEPEHGTIFNIFLLKYEGVHEIKELEETSISMDTIKTILLVEDEKPILRMITLALKEMGHNVLPTESPVEAIEIAKNFHDKIDLLITDVIMPEMNGRDLAKSILSIHPDIERLFMSGYTANVLAPHGIMENDVNFIQKPFEIADISNEINRIFKK